MVSLSNLTAIAASLEAASTSTEATFLSVGQALEGSVGILSDLTASFETALAQLKSEELSQSVKALAESALRINSLGRRELKATARFDNLSALADAIAARISQMNQSVEAADALVINSKVAAASIRSSTVEFATFASEIGRTMELTRSTLESFDSTLQTLRRCLQATHASQLAFEKRQDEAAEAIPRRLTAIVSALPQQHRRAAIAISAVRDRSELIQQQISAAVLALQAGDNARQRLEHVVRAIESLAGTEDGPAGQTARAVQTPSPFTVITCRLQAAQVSDTCEQFERDVQQIAASLRGLAGGANMLRSLASATYGASDGEQDTLMAQLEAEIAEALALFADFGTSQSAAVRVMTSVAETAESLCDHLRTVQSLEADIRIMGLNTTLRCARVGTEARALGVIAQDLRAYGHDFAKTAGALMADVEKLAATTRTLGARGADSTDLIASVTQTMQNARSTLQCAGQTLGATLDAIAQDSDRVVALLNETAAGLDRHHTIGGAMRTAVLALEEVTPPGEHRFDDMTSAEQDMLEQMAQVYTMAAERAVHDRIVHDCVEGRSTAPEQSAMVDVDLEDMLF